VGFILTLIYKLNFVVFCRIVANRESAAKSKEKKKRYLIELQKNVDLLEIQITNIINNICMFEVCIFLSTYYGSTLNTKIGNFILNLY